MSQHVRNVTELYVRAYWRYYLVAATWSAGVVVLWPR